MESKYDIITRNLQEVLGQDELKKILAERDITIYWGTAPTGKPHIGYFTPISKLADFLEAGCKVIILLADIHAFLDLRTVSFEEVKHRTEYYKLCIRAMLQGIGVPVDKLEFVVGSSFQLSKEYSLDTFRLSAIVTEHDAKKAGSEVVKQQKYPVISSLIYPNLQALDEEYLKCDAQFGGVDQRKIFIHAEKYMPMINYKKRIHLMNFMVPGLTGSKMSASDIDSKIDLFEERKSIEKKIKKAFCEEGNITENGVLSFVKYVLFPISSLQNNSKPKFELIINPKFGQNKTYTNYQELEKDFEEKKIHPGDLKNSVSKELADLLEKVTSFVKKEEIENLVNLAYPEPKKPEKKNKKQQDKQKNPKQSNQ